MKLCKDCKFKVGTRCSHESGIMLIDYVNGRNIYYECNTHRKKFGVDGECGPDAIHFSPKNVREHQVPVLEYEKQVQPESTFERIKSWLKQKI